MEYKRTIPLALRREIGSNERLHVLCDEEPIAIIFENMANDQGYEEIVDSVVSESDLEPILEG